MLLSIGEFARSSGLTPKALRLYDELGLLAPAAVDPHSGYRSYAPEQLGSARLIAALRGIGMPLARIRAVGELPPGAAAVEVRSWWRQVEIDVRERGQRAAVLVDDLLGKDEDMTDPSAPLASRIATRCERGRVRAENLDAVVAGARLIAVADGFGARGPAECALAALAGLEEGAPGADVVADLDAATGAARRAVAGVAGPGAGTTLTAMLFSGRRFALAHVGDSRVYLVRDGELALLTHDHTFVQSLVDEGRLTPEEAAAHPERARLVRALGPDLAPDPDLHLREARLGDRYLLCTDGLHAVVDEDQLRGTLRGGADAEATADALVTLALDAGGPDNVACAVVDVGALGRA